MSSKRNVPASEVRQWGRDNIASLPEEATKCLGATARGRLHPALRAAYAKANKGKGYAEKVAEVPTVEVKFKALDRIGRATTKTVTIPVTEARALLGQVDEDGKSTKGRFNMGLLSLAYEAKVLSEV